MTHTLLPACGGTEQPFTVNGKRWLYCWCPELGKHAYLNLDTDVAVWNRQFHPAWSPEYEHIPESESPRTPSHPETEEVDFYF